MRLTLIQNMSNHEILFFLRFKYKIIASWTFSSKLHHLLNASTKKNHHEYNVVDFNRRRFMRTKNIKTKKISYFPCHENMVPNAKSKASICWHEPIMGLLWKKLSKIRRWLQHWAPSKMFDPSKSNNELC